jgi:hypothetical protein
MQGARKLLLIQFDLRPNCGLRARVFRFFSPVYSNALSPCGDTASLRGDVHGLQ